ncbi:hypothetical protein BaRGS_00031436 [Batillaria attramentaria]|uniref:Uncharacterized protein n=1 Tax=Batillaria attramentaria TaxID=370345 RepID=A0ABD0JQA0_9CAEN
MTQQDGAASHSQHTPQWRQTNVVMCFVCSVDTSSSDSWKLQSVQLRAGRALVFGNMSHPSHKYRRQDEPSFSINRFWCMCAV